MSDAVRKLAKQICDIDLSPNPEAGARNIRKWQNRIDQAADEKYWLLVEAVEQAIAIRPYSMSKANLRQALQRVKEGI